MVDTESTPGAARARVDGLLRSLVAAGLVYRAGPGAGAEYSFKHRLTQEAAYGLLLHSEREDLHGVVGQVLEDRADEASISPAVLAHHFHHAKDPRTFPYAHLAADEALANHALSEAELHYTRALNSAEGSGAGLEQVADVHRGRGRTYELAGDFEAALADYEALEDLGRERGAEKLILHASIAKAKVFSLVTTAHNPDLAESYARNAIGIARRLGDREAEAQLQWILSLLHAFGENLEVAERHGRRALALAREQGLRELEAHVLDDLSSAYWFHGQVKRGLKHHQLATPIWTELSNYPMLASNLSQRAILQYVLGSYEPAMELAGQAKEIAGDIGNQWALSEACTAEAYVLYERGQIGPAMATFARAIEIANEYGLLFGMVFIASEWGWRLASLGDEQSALAQIDEAFATGQSTAPEGIAWPAAVKARILLRNGQVDLARELAATHFSSDYSKLIGKISLSGAFHVAMARGELAALQGSTKAAHDSMVRLLKGLRKSGARTYLPPALLLLAEIYYRLGREELGRQASASAVRIAEKLDAGLMSYDVYARSARLAELGNNTSRARALRTKAEGALDRLELNITEDQRKALRGLPQFRALHLT